METKTRNELGTQRDYKDGTVIRVGKYVLFVNGMNTRAELYDRPMIPLKANQMPIFIRDFVFS